MSNKTKKLSETVMEELRLVRTMSRNAYPGLEHCFETENDVVWQAISHLKRHVREHMERQNPLSYLDQ